MALTKLKHLHGASAAKLSKVAQPMHQQRQYFLEFANGQAWGFAWSESLKQWTKKFAAVMRLTEVDDCLAPKVVIASIEREKLDNRPALRDSFSDVQIPRAGWRMRDLKLIRLWTHQAVQDVICEMGTESSQELDIIRICMVLEPILMRAIDAGALPLHAGLVESEGRAALLAGPSGIGKTTCCLRIPAPWKAHCDDETLVLRDRSRRFVAHPFPTWSDLAWNRCERSWGVQQYFPLEAVFFLERGANDAVEPVSKVEMAMKLYSASVAVLQGMLVRLPVQEVRTLNRKLFDNACRMAQEIPGRKLKFRKTGRFWDHMERNLFPGRNKRRIGSSHYGAA